MSFGGETVRWKDARRGKEKEEWASEQGIEKLRNNKNKENI